MTRRTPCSAASSSTETSEPNGRSVALVERQTVEEIARSIPAGWKLHQAHAAVRFLIASGSMVSARLDYVNPLGAVDHTPVWRAPASNSDALVALRVAMGVRQAIGLATADPVIRSGDPGSEGHARSAVHAGRRRGEHGRGSEVPILSGLGIEVSSRRRYSSLRPFSSFVLRIQTLAHSTTQIAHATAGHLP